MWFGISTFMIACLPANSSAGGTIDGLADFGGRTAL